MVYLTVFISIHHCVYVLGQANWTIYGHIREISTRIWIL